MEEGGQEVGVVDCDGKFLEDVLVAETALLEAMTVLADEEDGKGTGGRRTCLW